MKLNESIIKNLNESSYREEPIYIIDGEDGYIYGSLAAILSDYRDYKSSYRSYYGTMSNYNYYNCSNKVKKELNKYMNTLDSFSIKNNQYNSVDDIDMKRPTLLGLENIYYDNEAKSKFNELKANGNCKKYQVIV